MFCKKRVLNFIKRMRLKYNFFPVNSGKFLRTPFLQNTSVRMFLNCEEMRVSDMCESVYYTFMTSIFMNRSLFV